MPCTEKKAQANRKNAQKSTGPKSREGKARVALNAVKHGLRAEHLVLPGEDAAAFDAMLASWMDDWGPPTDARRVLVEQAVAHAWRLRRCLKAERLHLMERARAEVSRRRGEAEARARHAVADLGHDPASALEDLLASRAGAEAVLGLWRELADVAGDESWDDAEEHHHALLRLLGLDPDEVDPESLQGAADASRWLVEWNEMRRPTSPFQRPRPTRRARPRPRGCPRCSRRSWPSGSPRWSGTSPTTSRPIEPRPRPRPSWRWPRRRRRWTTRTRAGRSCVRGPARPRVPRHAQPARQADPDRRRPRRGRAVAVGGRRAGAGRRGSAARARGAEQSHRGRG